MLFSRGHVPRNLHVTEFLAHSSELHSIAGRLLASSGRQPMPRGRDDLGVAARKTHANSRLAQVLRRSTLPPGGADD